MFGRSMLRLTVQFLAKLAVENTTEGFPQILYLFGDTLKGFPHLFRKTQKRIDMSDFRLFGGPLPRIPSKPTGHTLILSSYRSR